MKKFLLFFAIYSISIYSQVIPNSGFENWNSSNLVDWYTSNVGNMVLPVTKTPAYHSGSYALKGEVINVINNPVPPLIISGANADGFSITVKPESLICYLQFYPINEDKFNIIIEMSNGNMVIGTGSLELNSTIESYTRIAVPIQYINNDIPDRCIIIFGTAANATPHVGTFFLIDDLQFPNVTYIATNESITGLTFELQQNFPNPFNPSTIIKYSLPLKSTVRIDVYDLLGNKIQNLVNEEKPSGNYEITWNAGNLSSGMYLYRLQAGLFIQTKKMILIK